MLSPVVVSIICNLIVSAPNYKPIHSLDEILSFSPVNATTPETVFKFTLVNAVRALALEALPTKAPWKVFATIPAVVISNILFHVAFC